LNKVLIGPTGNLVDQSAIIQRFRFIAPPKIETQPTQKRAEVRQLLNPRTFMDANQMRHFVPLQESRRCIIGGQHALFNQLVSIIS